MEQNFSANGEYVFRGIEYRVNFQTVQKSGQCLSVEVEDKVTGDQWKGVFDSNYIEDLTRKTGNFKQFDVFMSMLESALDKTTESVTLDLLTFADLELLRNRKAVSGGYRATKPRTTSRQQENKRYLILIYSVEFDRIHYPLPLPYQGKPDPVYLQNLVRELNDEISKLKCGKGSGDCDGEFMRLKEDYDAILREKQSLEQALIELKSELQSGSKLSVSKEVRILKKVVQNLEMEMMKEKNRFHRLISKKSAENKRLNAELQDLSAKERTLNIRVKSLTNELALYKRRTPTAHSSRDVHSRNSASRPSSRTRPGSSILRPSSRGSQSGSFYQRRSTSRDRPPSVTRDRSSSREARPYLQSGGYKSRTPTPNRFTRFNPTLYNEEKKRKLQESQERVKRRSGGYGRASSDGRGRSKTRVGVARLSSGSRNRNGSLDSRNSSDNGTMPRRPRKWADSPIYPAEGRRLSSTPDVDRHRPGKRLPRQKRTITNDPDIDEIDARLEALQQYMREIEKK